ncbi:hypothetical protein Sa4125_34620 [Aureimonas sp. SA4125]|nr:hypothetical protein Sa4125_34620 [Aureimonas sp. SA4125]
MRRGKRAPAMLRLALLGRERMPGAFIQRPGRSAVDLGGNGEPEPVTVLNGGGAGTRKVILRR